MASNEIDKYTLEEVGFLAMRGQADKEAEDRGAYRQDGVLVYEDAHRDKAIAELKELDKLPPEKQAPRKLKYRVEAA
jgi:hypothetical protein